MKEKSNRINLALGMSFVALIIALTSIFVSFRTFGLGNMDYIGFFLLALTLLITILIGWNIYSVINIKDIKGEIDEKVNDTLEQIRDDTCISISETKRNVYKIVDEKISTVNKNLEVGISQTIAAFIADQAIIWLSLNQFEFAFRCLFMAIDQYVELRNKYTDKGYENEIGEELQKIRTTINFLKKSGASINPRNEDKTAWIKSLVSIQEFDIMDIMNFIVGLTSKEDCKK